MTRFEETIFRGIEAVLKAGAEENLGDRTQYIGSSDVSGCLLRAYLNKVAPADHTEGTLVNFLRGHVAEEIIARALAGKYKYQWQVEVAHPAKPYLRAHIDIVFGDLSNGRVSILEIKSTTGNPSDPYEGWIRQLVYQMAIVRSVNPEAEIHGAILGFDILKPEVRLYRPLDAKGLGRQMDAMIERAERLYQALQQSGGDIDYSLAEPGVLCTYCSYRGGKCRVNAVDGDGVLDLSSIGALIEEYQALKEQSDALDRRMGEIRQAILDFMGDHEFGRSNGYLVERKVVVSNRLDTNALRKSHPEIYQQFTRQVESVRLTIKPAGTEG